MSRESQKARDWLAVLEGRCERVSAGSNSLISTKIQGIFVETPLPAGTDPLKEETSLDEFPAVVTGNFLLQLGKNSSANSELRVSLVGGETDVAAVQVRVRL